MCNSLSPRTETAQASKTPGKHIRTLAVVVVNDESYKQRGRICHSQLYSPTDSHTGSHQILGVLDPTWWSAAHQLPRRKEGHPALQPGSTLPCLVLLCCYLHLSGLFVSLFHLQCSKRGAASYEFDPICSGGFMLSIVRASNSAFWLNITSCSGCRKINLNITICKDSSSNMCTKNRVLSFEKESHKSSPCPPALQCINEPSRPLDWLICFGSTFCCSYQAWTLKQLQRVWGHTISEWQPP